MKQDQLGVYEKAMPNAFSIAQKLELAERAGFDFLELSVDETDEKLSRLDMDAAQRRLLNAAQAASGVRLRSMCLSGQRKYPMGSSDPAVERRSMDILGKAIEFAAQTGIRVIQLAGYDVYYEPSGPDTQRRFEQNLLRAVEWAAAYGVVLALETMENDFMNTCAKAMRYVRLAGSPYLAVYPDTGNITNATADPCGDLRTGRGHIVAAHLKETLPGVFREVPFGQGHTDFPSVIDTLRRMGVHTFLLEFWYDGKTDALSYLTEARAFMLRQFEKAGVRL